MTDVVLSATSVPTTGTTMLVHLFLVTEDADWNGDYDQLQFYRSTIGEEGPYEELTAADWAYPRLPLDAGDQPSSPVTGPSINIVGAELIILVNRQTTRIVFTGSDPLTYAQVATQITAQGLGRLRSYVDSAGKLAIEALYPGLQSQMSILASDGAVLLGLSTVEPDNTDVGQDPRLRLTSGKKQYDLVDYFGSRDYYYRSRFRNSVTGAESEPSAAWRAGDVATDIDVILGYALLVDIRGVPMQNEVRLHTESSGTSVDGKVIVGSTQVKRPDATGRVEFQLVRGQRATVTVQGTMVARTITVPTDPDVVSFNLFGSDIGPFDSFRAAVPELITAERRTL